MQPGPHVIEPTTDDAPMEFLLIYSLLLQVLTYAQIGFTIWMLVDAYRRQAEPFWFFIILTGVGAWAYFFIVKLGDFSNFKLASLFQKRTSLAELRYRAEQSATIANRWALAERLVEAGECAEAIPHLQAVLAREPEHCHALYALAMCHVKEDRPAEAISLLEKINARDNSWSDYAAWKLLVLARAKSGDGAGALATCRELARLAPTLQHRCLLADQLLNAGLTDEARALLEKALDDHRFSPSPIRRRNYSWASKARRLQKQAVSR